MHAERGRSPRQTADAINAARAAGGRVVAVGTTSLRLLESAASEDGHAAAVHGRNSAVHPAGLPLQGGGSAADQLPSATLDPVDAGIGFSAGASGCWRPTPMRWRPATGSTPMATRASWTSGGAPAFRQLTLRSNRQPSDAPGRGPSRRRGRYQARWCEEPARSIAPRFPATRRRARATETWAVAAQ